MKRTIRENINTSYSLHDMNVIAFDVMGDDVIMRTQSGMVKTTPPKGQPDGYVEFHNVCWDYSYAYLLDFSGNIGNFSGEKMFLKDFISKFVPLGFSITDETYGYNTTKYSGYLTYDRCHYECIIEIYHEGDMFFVDETEFKGMEKVILSTDDKAKIYLVPAEVAYDLQKYCLEFATDWVWHAENAKYLKKHKNQYVAVFNESDFIDYLNRWIFPEHQSTLIKELDYYDYELPDEYRIYPRFNF